MNSSSASIPVVLAIVLAAPPVLAQTVGDVGAAGTAGATSESASAAANAQRSRDLESRLETAQRRLEAAQRQLETAANEVAELSAERGNAVIRRYSFVTGGQRAVVGVQLDSTSGGAGARVLDVSPGGPAAEAGVRAGDVITTVNGTSVKGDDAARQVVRILRDVKPESKVRLEVARNGKTQAFTLTARSGPEFSFYGGGEAPWPPLPALPARPGQLLQPAQPAPPAFSFGPGSMPFLLGRGPLADMELATLTPGLGKYFGTDKGVLVVRAPTDGALKLQDGDVILSIDGRVPESGPHATRILGSYQAGEKLDLRVMRDRKRTDIETTMPEGGQVRERVYRSGDLSAPRARGRVFISRGGETI